MPVEIKRLHLASLRGPDGLEWPVHGFVITHPGGAVLVDTGVGGPPQVLSDWRVVNRSVADALAGLDMTPGDIGLVINTHLHFDHCGQNVAIPHARTVVQRRERERVRHKEPDIEAWLNVSGVKFELIDGETELATGLRVVPTPGHTSGHQCVVATAPDGADLFIGDAAFRRSVWDAPSRDHIAPGQAEDVSAWEDSLRNLHALTPARVHFCHDAS